MPSAPCKLTFDLLTLKVVSKSRLTWATSVPILVFLGLSVLDVDRRTRQTDVRQTSRSCPAPCKLTFDLLTLKSRVLPL